MKYNIFYKYGVIVEGMFYIGINDVKRQALLTLNTMLQKHDIAAAADVLEVARDTLHSITESYFKKQHIMI